MRNIAFLIVSCSFASAAHAETVINVDAGQVLNEADLLAGEFNGQQFALGPDLTININDGGTLGPFGFHSGSCGVLPGQAFDFSGSTIHIRNGGSTSPATVIEDAVIVVHEGAVIAENNTFYRSDSIRIEGGEFADGLFLIQSQIEILGGSFFGDSLGIWICHSDFVIRGGDFRPGSLFFESSVGTISGGVFLGFNSFFGGNMINVVGGTLTGFGVNSGTVNVSGVTISSVNASPHGGGRRLVNISGGGIDRLFGESGCCESTTTFDLFVTELHLDGVPIDLAPGETMEFPQRGCEELGVILADGTPMMVVLGEGGFCEPGDDNFDFGTTVKATMVPPHCPGDADWSGQVDFGDITTVLAHWRWEFFPSAQPGDANDDGVVDFGDVTAVLAEWGESCP